MIIKTLNLLISIFIVFYAWGNMAYACPACYIGSGSGNKRDNKPLTDLRKIYEEKGKDALPYIREALKTGTDPLVIKRAANYLVVLNDTESIPQMENMLLDLIKRVAFTTFGLGIPEFRSRLAVAHALIKFGPTTVGDRIWEKYDRLDWKRKDEVPYILNALKDPRLDERMITILNKAEDHQLMLGALEVLAIGGSAKDLPYLESMATEWRNKGTGTGTNPRPDAQEIDYMPLTIRADNAIYLIKRRNR